MLALLALAALAAAPSEALAKGAISGRVCGADGCADVTRDKLGGMLAEGDPTDPPASAAPFVEIRLKVITGENGETANMAFDYLPSLGITRPHDGGDGGAWIRLHPSWRASLDGAVGATRPRPASELARIAGLPEPVTQPHDGPGWWVVAAGALALLGLVALLARIATNGLRSRPRTS